MAIIGKGLSVLALKALISVTTKPGSTVTFKLGSVTMSTQTANSSGVCSLEVLVPNFGTWTISAVNGTASGSATVTVSDTVTYSVTVNMVMYLIRNGNFSSGFSHTLVPPTGSTNCGFTDDGDYIHLHTLLTNHSWQRCAGYFSAINFSDGFWKNIVIDYQAEGDPARVGLVSGTPTYDPSYSVYKNLNSRNTNLTARATSTLDISSQSGSKYVTLRAAAWTYEDEWGTVMGWTAGRLYVYNLYLRSY